MLEVIEAVELPASEPSAESSSSSSSIGRLYSLCDNCSHKYSSPTWKQVVNTQDALTSRQCSAGRMPSEEISCCCWPLPPLVAPDPLCPALSMACFDSKRWNVVSSLRNSFSAFLPLLPIFSAVAAPYFCVSCPMVKLNEASKKGREI